MHGTSAFSINVKYDSKINARARCYIRHIFIWTSCSVFSYIARLQRLWMLGTAVSIVYPCPSGMELYLCDRQFLRWVNLAIVNMSMNHLLVIVVIDTLKRNKKIGSSILCGMIYGISTFAAFSGKSTLLLHKVNNPNELTEAGSHTHTHTQVSESFWPWPNSCVMAIVRRSDAVVPNVAGAYPCH